jgi:hypothetical protein
VVGQLPSMSRLLPTKRLHHEPWIVTGAIAWLDYILS